MKILVIDSAGPLTAFLSTVDTELAFYKDEVQALNSAEQLRPALIFLDYAVRGEKTPDYIRLLLTVAPGVGLVVIGDDIAEDDIFRCLLAGARGYHERQSLPQYLDKLIHVVTQGEAWVSRKMIVRLLDAIRQLCM